MSSLALEKNYPINVSLNNKSGDKLFPIWLLVDPRYPAIYHSMWLPLLEEIQDRVYRKLHTRIDTKKIFIENAASDLGAVPNTLNCGVTDVNTKIKRFRNNLIEFQPKILITFGVVTYEFVRLTFKKRNEKLPKYLRSTDLSIEFERSISKFDINLTNMIPLQSRVLNGGKFIDDINDLNYFREVGWKIADKIIENKDSLNIWIK